MNRLSSFFISPMPASSPSGAFSPPPVDRSFGSGIPPERALFEGFKDQTRKEIQEVLERPDYHFLGGSALNWTTTLRYEGSTKSLTTFLHALAACEGVRIKISFVESLPGEGVWRVHHSAHEDEGLGFQIRISLDPGKIGLTELVIPEIRVSSNAEQASDGNSATRSESHSGGGGKPQPESEGRSR